MNFASARRRGTTPGDSAAGMVYSSRGRMNLYPRGRCAAPMDTDAIMALALKLARQTEIPADSGINVPASRVKKVLFGIDVDSGELLMAKGKGYDLVICHHPTGDSSQVNFPKILQRQGGLPPAAGGARGGGARGGAAPPPAERRPPPKRREDDRDAADGDSQPLRRDRTEGDGRDPSRSPPAESEDRRRAFGVEPPSGTPEA